MGAMVSILGEEFWLDCSAGDQRRIEDLAKALEARASAAADETSDLRRLILAALALIDETQTTGAALARARGEIERLNDMLAEAQIEAAEGPALQPEQGLVRSLRAPVA